MRYSNCTRKQSITLVTNEFLLHATKDVCDYVVAQGQLHPCPMINWLKNIKVKYTRL